jgi:hypothetical protein
MAHDVTRDAMKASLHVVDHLAIPLLTNTNSGPQHGVLRWNARLGPTPTKKEATELNGRHAPHCASDAHFAPRSASVVRGVAHLARRASATYPWRKRSDVH